MNGGNRTRGQADGFTVDILPKLKDVKSSVSRGKVIPRYLTVHMRDHRPADWMCTSITLDKHHNVTPSYTPTHRD